MVRNHQKKIYIVFFVPKITNTFYFSSQKSKQIGCVFLGLFTWNHPIGSPYFNHYGDALYDCSKLGESGCISGIS